MTVRFAFPHVRWLAVALAACMALAGFLVASSSAATEPSTITLCIKRSGPTKGTVRFAGGTKCQKTEQRVQLIGSSGSQGVLGIQGSSGETGPAGAQGSPGAPGADGPDGTDGTDGTDGEDGEDGAPGPSGVSTTFVDSDSGTDSISEGGTNLLVTPSSVSITAGQWSTVTAWITVSKSTSNSRTVKCGFREGSTGSIPTAVGTMSELTLSGGNGQTATIALSHRWQPTAGNRFIGVACTNSNSSSLSATARTMSGMITNG